MMRRDLARVGRGVAVLTAAAAMAVMSMAAPAGAATPAPRPVTIIATADDGPGFGGTWTASGAVADAGSYERTDVHFSHSIESSPAVGAFQATLEFSGAEGTFVVQDELLFSSGGLNGTWRLVSGTGRYAGATGHGTSSFDFTAGATTFEGVLALDDAV